MIFRNGYERLKRIFDFVLASAFMLVLAIPMLLIAAAVKLTSRGPVIYWSNRVGIDNAVFSMPKFRTMRLNTPVVATHLLGSPDAYLTTVGKLLRKTSLDELPQLWSILQGRMSFVGPRPALYNQEDLIMLRTERGVHRLMPGITGWAQINGRDDLPIPIKVEYDVYYLMHRSFMFDLRIIIATFTKVVRREGINH